MTIQILPPFPAFTDIDGDPLSDGFIYIGVSGLDPIANPISAFFDMGLTIPAAQPIRTIGGYPSNAGVPARLYVSQQDYSILVRNKNSTQISLSLSAEPILIIGTTVQAQDADLQALANNATNGILVRTGAGTAAARTITGTANKITATNGDGVSGNPSLTIPDVVTLVTPTVTGLLTVSGGQIAFPATQVPSAGANTLDDYEEGTWTNVITFATPGNLVVAYTTQTGDYTKIGRNVNIVGNIITSTFTHTTASGSAQITGFPFTMTGPTGAGTLIFQGITKANYTQFGPRLSSGGTLATIFASAQGQSALSVTSADMPTGGTVVLQYTCNYNA